jgi:carbon storage regulator
MLVVTRKKDEKLMIGNEIEVQIIKISKDSVRIGIKAPQNISVHRWEVFESIRDANLAASKSQVPQKMVFRNLIPGSNAPERKSSGSPEPGPGAVQSESSSEDDSKEI